MKPVMWLLGLALAAAIGYWVRHVRRRWQERSRAAEQRYASFMAETLGQAQNSRSKGGSQPRAPGTSGQG